MLYRLAELLGMTVERILAEMTVTERYGWILYFAERAAEHEEAAREAPAQSIGRGGRSTGNLMAMTADEAHAALKGLQ